MAETDGAPGTGDGTGDGTQTFTQADVDRIVRDRLTREQSKYADYNDLKAKAAKFDETVAAQQTETEKAVQAARTETETAVRTEVQRERVLDRVEALAAKDFADPEDARLRLASKADTFVKDGKPDSDAIKAALADLLKTSPHLAGAENRRFKGGADQGTRDTASAAKKDEREVARALFGGT